MQALRIVWSSSNSTAQVQSAEEGKEKGEEAMARRKLTKEQQLKGVRAALRSPRTPPQLKDGLRRREAVLLKVLKRRKRITSSPRAN
jgi:hypothetical protein